LLSSQLTRIDLRHFKDLGKDFPHISVSADGVRTLLGAFVARVSGPKNSVPGRIADEVQKSSSSAFEDQFGLRKWVLLSSSALLRHAHCAREV
jgi:hypothetical protein